MKWFLIAFFCFFTVSRAVAFGIVVTEIEFRSWDDRCKKAFSASGAGRSSGFFPNMTNQQHKEAYIFGQGAGGAWHYCAGVILLQRAGGTKGQEREGNLIRAIAEMRFTINIIEPDHQWYPEMHINYARAHYLNGNKIEAFAILNRLMNSHPNNSLPYTALAYYLKKENNLGQAITVLKKAPALLLNESAELNYFLGWYLMEADEAEAAVPYAKRAYALNYPVPTLRQRLAATGHNW